MYNSCTNKTWVKNMNAIYVFVLAMHAWRCNTSGNHYKPAAYGELCLRYSCATQVVPGGSLRLVLLVYWHLKTYLRGGAGVKNSLDIKFWIFQATTGEAGSVKLVSTNLTSLVPLEQFHHKPMIMHETTIIHSNWFVMELLHWHKVCELGGDRLQRPTVVALRWSITGQ